MKMMTRRELLLMVALATASCRQNRDQRDESETARPAEMITLTISGMV